MASAEFSINISLEPRTGRGWYGNADAERYTVCLDGHKYVFVTTNIERLDICYHCCALVQSEFADDHAMWHADKEDYPT